jgi:hypothetical protein
MRDFAYWVQVAERRKTEGDLDWGRDEILANAAAMFVLAAADEAFTEVAKQVSPEFAGRKEDFESFVETVEYQVQAGAEFSKDMVS